MEALVALGLACNVMQILSYASETCSLWKRLLETGDTHPTLRENATAITTLSASLRDSLTNLPHPISEAETQLLSLANSCLAASDGLICELNRTAGIAAKGKLGAAIKSAVKLRLGQSRLERLAKDVQAYRETLESGLLLRIWCAMVPHVPQSFLELTRDGSTLADANALRQRQDFHTLDSTFQGFVIAYSNGQTRVSDLVTGVKQQVSTEFTKFWDESIRTRLLRSLKYDGMNERRNTIAHCYSGTYQWVFQDGDSDAALDVSSPSRTAAPGESDRPTPSWDSFTDWLRSDGQVYWVNGKAGAGKSTLMEFLARDPRTRQALQSWSLGARLVSHFLWSSGTAIQQSVKGCLCAFLHQILLTDNSLLGAVLQQFPTTQMKDEVADWSEEELEEILLRAFSNAAAGTCIFIDGLDEILPSDGPFKLLDFMSRLQRAPGIKLCLSSRPEPAFEKYLGERPKLRLQDLTNHDIHRFVTAGLEPVLLSGAEETHPASRQLIQTICENAEGIFLWAQIVVDSLKRGLANGDTLDDLSRRIKTAPKGLYELFQDMWRRLGDDVALYQASAARYFNLVLSSRGIKGGHEPFRQSVLEMVIASDKSITKSVPHHEIGFDAEILSRKCKAFITIIASQCAGILECTHIRGNVITAHPGPYDSLFHFYETQVHFTHRTARDFLTTTVEGSEILSYDQSSLHDRFCDFLRADLVVAQMWTLILSVSPPGSDTLNTNSAACWLRNLGVLGCGAEDIPLTSPTFKELLWQCYRLHKSGCFPYFLHRIQMPISMDEKPDFICAMALAGISGLVGSLPDSLKNQVDHSYTAYVAHCLVEGMCRAFAGWSRLHRDIKTHLISVTNINERTLLPSDFGFNLTEARLQMFGCPQSLHLRITSHLLGHRSKRPPVHMLRLLGEILSPETSLSEQVVVCLCPGRAEEMMLWVELVRALEHLDAPYSDELAIFTVSLGYLLRSTLEGLATKESEQREISEPVEACLRRLPLTNSGSESPRLLAIKKRQSFSDDFAAEFQLWQPKDRDNTGSAIITLPESTTLRYSWSVARDIISRFCVFFDGRVWDFSSVSAQDYEVLPLSDFLSIMRKGGHLVMAEDCGKAIPRLPPAIEEAVMRESLRP